MAAPVSVAHLVATKRRSALEVVMKPTTGVPRTMTRGAIILRRPSRIGSRRRVTMVRCRRVLRRRTLRSAIACRWVWIAHWSLRSLRIIAIKPKPYGGPHHRSLRAAAIAIATTSTTGATELSLVLRWWLMAAPLLRGGPMLRLGMLVWLAVLRLRGLGIWLRLAIRLLRLLVGLGWVVWIGLGRHRMDVWLWVCLGVVWLALFGMPLLLLRIRPLVRLGSGIGRSGRLSIRRLLRSVTISWSRTVICSTVT